LYRQTRKYTGLSNKRHTLTVTVLGTRRRASSGTWVTVDAMSTAASACSSGATCVVNPSQTYRWSRIRSSRAADGWLSRTDTAGATVSLKFVGTGFTLYRLVGPREGKAGVYVDGRLIATLNSYTASDTVRAYTKKGLPRGTHTLVVKALHRSGSTTRAAFNVSVDRVVVR
jgi:hypothetical protein